MIKAVAFDKAVLERLQVVAEIEVDWVGDFSTPPASLNCQRVERDGVVYFLAPGATEGTKLLIIDLGLSSGFFNSLEPEHRIEALLRLTRMALLGTRSSAESLPHSWGPYHAGSRLSFYARHGSLRQPTRIEADLNPRGTKHVYAYLMASEKHKLADFHIDYAAFDAATNGFQGALLQQLEFLALDRSERSELYTQYSLSTRRDSDELGSGRSASEWLALFTKEQRAFVNCGLDRSVRLVGAAGTGKSLSLIVKCLLDFEKQGGRPEGFRALFLTFSQSTVDRISNAIASMDHTNVLNRWSASSLKICTLQTLAYEALKLEEIGLQPFTSDGLEGREWQRMLIDEQLLKFRRAVWPTVQARCNEWFSCGVEAPPGSDTSRRFVDSLMNEFACVLEAQAVRSSPEARNRYLNEKRKPWMLKLDTSSERQSVLELYDRFREKLREQQHISPDQVTADFLVELGTNRWDRVRERLGYDVVFVDELHLFNRQERMIPHLLTRDPAKLVIIMAYDMKQSVRDTFAGSLSADVATGGVSREMGLGSTERFELNETFRHTPEIAAVLEWIDLALPAVGIAEDLGDEWRKVTVKSLRGAGRRPMVAYARDTAEIFDTVFPRAQRRARHLKKGRNVAVLCLSESLFEKYARAGRFKDAFVAVTEKEELSSISRAGQRFVLSTPEFVAGMQFDTVYLIEVNDGEVPDDPREIGTYRQFVSQTYIGASRAANFLEFYCSKERGGASRCLRLAIQNRALDVVDINKLPAEY